MSSDNLFFVFDAWDILVKARQPKGLAKWDKLSSIADSLKGKKASDITFTTCYPGSEGQKKTLGSVEGNLHFLMGYANPAFHIASYHYQVVDPTLSASDAQLLYRSKGHPSRPELWERTDLEMNDEGDLVYGEPHPAVADVRDMEKLKNARKAESITVSSGIGSYTAIPSEGIVYGNHNNQVYAWEMVKESFFAAANPDLTEKMNEAAAARQSIETELSKPSDVPELVKHVANKYYGQEFSDDIYSIVKSYFPIPSSIVPLDANTGEVIYGVITPSSIDFYNKEGCSSGITIYDSSFNSLDLTKGGNTYASVIHSLGTTYFGVPRDLDQYVKNNTIIGLPYVLRGTPTEGLENVGTQYNEVNSLSKSVIIDDGTFRLVINE
jgi:hypothetical protein